MLIQFYLILFSYFLINDISNGLLISNIHNKKLLIKVNTNPFGKKYYEQYLQPNRSSEKNEIGKIYIRKYPLIKPDFLEKIQKLNSKNKTEQENAILENHLDDNDNHNDNDNDNHNNNNNHIIIIINNKT
jgi:hypothetical protein